MMMLQIHGDVNGQDYQIDLNLKTKITSIYQNILSSYSGLISN